MHFARLRLSGFKSFVEPTELRIEPGLTGIVGPNGCGKSNLLEALRWVMGAASAKAIRGEGMDDVIFAGAAGRPSRNHAEVVLTIDNEARDGPAQWREPMLEVSRRIERGEGSTFRINGGEVRARDVQLLFADASTGANSPALVRQGQISELIAAKPQNRRRILEEAAGTSGLMGRRREAELKVEAAQLNLDRLDDVRREIDATLGRLRREARQAARYKALAAEIRDLRGQTALAAFEAARAEAALAEAEQGRLAEESRVAIAAAAAAAARAISAAEGLPAAQEAERAAGAKTRALEIEFDRLERTLEAAAATERRLGLDLERFADDATRERQIETDAAAALARLEAEKARLVTSAEAPGEETSLESAARQAQAARAAAEAALEARLAADAAAQARRDAAAARVAEAQERVRRAEAALAAFAAETGSLNPEAAWDEAAVIEARGAMEAAQAARVAAAAAEDEARRGWRALDDELGILTSQARGLAGVAVAPAARGPGVVEQVKPAPGLEAAVAAALGDDLFAGLDAAAPAFWAGALVEPPVWPAGAMPIAPLVAAPPQLAARLAFVAVVEAKDGPRLQKVVPPGARLVSRAGDLWRWDGLTVAARAQRPAQARMEQRARLEKIEARIEALRPEAVAARAGFEAAQKALAKAETVAGEARRTLDRAEAGLAAARRDAGRAVALEEARETAAAALASAEAALAETSAAESPRGSADALRAQCLAARQAEAEAQTARMLHRNERAAHEARSRAVNGEIADWRRRLQSAADRLASLAQAEARARAERAEAAAAPGLATERRETLLEALAGAAQAHAAARDRLDEMTAARDAAESESRQAQGRASQARDEAAPAAARAVAAQARLDERRARIVEAFSLSPEALARRIGAQEGPALDHAAGEARLAELERARDAIGAVNLLAETEAQTLAERAAALAAEREDLDAALGRLRAGLAELTNQGRERLAAAFEVIDGHFRDLFQTLFEGGEARLRLIEAEDPLEAGLEILASPPGKRLALMSLMSGGEQALTALALILAVFLANPAPICVLDEVDAPLDDANVERFCALLKAMVRRASTRFLVITHNPLTMSRMDRLFGVTMPEAGASQLVSVDLRQAEALAAA